MTSSTAFAQVLRQLLLAVAVLPALAQPQNQVATGGTRRFEVATIKPSKPGSSVRERQISFPPARFEATSITLAELLLAMYGFSGRVEGGPKWMESERYDIVAKAAAEIAPGERNRIVMALLEDRFQLVARSETREEPGLALTLGKKPPKLDAANDSEPTVIRPGDRRQVIFQGVGMSRLALYLSQMLQKQVVDRTRLTGKFDFVLDPYNFAAVASTQSPLPTDSYADLLQTAVERFGFRLEPQRVPVRVTVVDHAERPTEN